MLYFYYNSYMKIFGLEKVSLVDFDGHICATIFTGGCNFRCPFCHNSDLVNIKHVEEYSEKEIFEYLDKRKNMLDSVCVSGGEPTLQTDLPEFIAELKARGFLVKLDSNGTNFKMLKKLIDEKLIDYVAMDIKNSLEGYPAIVGTQNVNYENIKKSVELLKQNKVPYEFRITLVKGFHTEKSIADMAEWLQGAEKLFLQKFVDSGNCIESGLTEIDIQTAEKFKAILQRKIKFVALRGY